jgi:DNA-binding CsgD family transcriptional regulator
LNCWRKDGTRKAVTQKLCIGKWTLYKHLYKIRKRLGVNNTPEMLHVLRTRPGNAVPALRFSPRGKEVFLLITEGLTNSQIGGRMGMSVSGVKRHKEKMLLQNNCSTLLELIAKYHC